MEKLQKLCKTERSNGHQKNYVIFVDPRFMRLSFIINNLKSIQETKCPQRRSSNLKNAPSRLVKSCEEWIFFSIYETFPNQPQYHFHCRFHQDDEREVSWKADILWHTFFTALHGAQGEIKSQGRETSFWDISVYL